MEFLKNHPFAVETFFQSSLVLTYALKKEELKNLIPPCLELDTFNNEWAFLAVAMVKANNLRPKGFPSFLGNDFFLIGFRIFVKYIDRRGKRLRGLYIIKSETNKKKMSLLGNIFTHYKYNTTDIYSVSKNNSITIRSSHSGLDIEVKKEPDTPLPPGSPFTEWKQARRYAGPLPFTFTFKDNKKEVLIIEGVRQNWTPNPVKVIKNKIDFLSGFRDPVLANAFLVENIPYFWKKGRIEKWDQ